jgi:hypothetical protein
LLRNGVWRQVLNDELCEFDTVVGDVDVRWVADVLFAESS